MSNKMNIIDLIAIIPFYITYVWQQSTFEAQSFTFVRVMRLAKIFRVFKVGRYSAGARVYVEVLGSSAEALSLLLFFSCLTSVVMGSAIYIFEKGDLVMVCFSYIR